MSATATPATYALAERFSSVDAARAAYGSPVVDRLLAGCFETDAAGDALVNAFRRLPGGAGWHLLEDALSTDSLRPSTRPDTGPRDTAPPELAALLDPISTLPDWVDPARLRAGAVAYWRAGAGPLGLSLTCGALAYGYQSASLSRPLAATGRLEHRAPRRLGETARWLVSVTTPGAMVPGGEGFAACVRVRVVHALVRAHLLRAGGGWDVANWGIPMSASDAGSTAMGGFLTLHLEAMHDLGVHYSRQELEDMTHLWAWIAVVMGVPADLAPPVYARGTAPRSRLGWRSTVARARIPRASCTRCYTTRRLSSACARSSRKDRLTALHAQVLAGFTRRWMGDDMADRLRGRGARR